MSTKFWNKKPLKSACEYNFGRVSRVVNYYNVTCSMLVRMEFSGIQAWRWMSSPTTLKKELRNSYNDT